MALTKDRNTEMKDGELISVPMAASAKIFAGSLVVANATGYAAPGSVATALTVLGRAEEQKDNTNGSDGDVSILIRRKKTFKFGNYGSDLVTQADVGKTCYIYDDETVAKTDGTSTRSAAGKVIAVESDGVWVEID